ncbi:MAG: leucine-rich repeat protein [Bacteroidales bacterium]|nr:leucine-rich repeat protein [Bacteroidales bacterium]MBQ9313213.1 leucine-rich repeat protein [Bacteroidales bacterium]
MKHYITSILSFICLVFLVQGNVFSQSFYMAEHTGQSIHYEAIPKTNNEVRIVKDFLSNRNYILLRNEVRLVSVVENEGKSFYVTTIGKKAFEGVEELKEIVVTSGITNIEKEAFLSCKKLTKLTLYGAQRIGDNAFKGCENINSVIIFTSYPPVLGKEVFDEKMENATLYVPDRALVDYKKSEWSKYFTKILGTSNLGYSE